MHFFMLRSREESFQRNNVFSSIRQNDHVLLQEPLAMCNFMQLKILGEAFWHVYPILPRLLWRSKESRVHYFATNARLLEKRCTSLYTTSINFSEFKMCLLISHRGSSFCPCILHWTYVFTSVKCEARLFRVTPHHFNTDFILRDRKPIIEIWS
jgi:hypothetical protein